jgi:hypothetical protein
LYIFDLSNQEVNIKTRKENMKIQNRELTQDNYLDKVTYIPQHLNGDASKGEPGVIISWNDENIKVWGLEKRI